MEFYAFDSKMIEKKLNWGWGKENNLPDHGNLIIIVCRV